MWVGSGLKLFKKPNYENPSEEIGNSHVGESKS